MKSSTCVTLIAAALLPLQLHGQIRALPRTEREEQQLVVSVDQYRFKFFNDLNGFVVADESAPLVRFSAFIRGGTADDRSQGAAEVLADIIEHEGPCWIAPRTLETVLNDLHANLDVRMGVTLTEITLTAPAGRERDALRVFSGLVREPCIRTSTVARFRASVVAGERQGDGVRDLSTLFERHLYHEHPFGFRVSEGDLEELKVDDVTRFHEEFFMPSNVILAVSGGFETEALIVDLDQRFADWRRVRRPPRFGRPPEVDEEDSTKIYRDRSGGARYRVMVGQALRDVVEEDWPALQVLNHVLTGGDGTGRVRSVQLGALHRGFRGTATYSIKSRNATDVPERFIEEIARELERVRSEPVTDRELEAAKTTLIRVEFPNRFADGHVTARTLAMEFVRDTTLVGLRDYGRTVEELSAREIQRVADRYLRPDGLVVVMVAEERQ